MKIAVQGCCHGELDAIYEHIHRLESRNNYKVDLLLICGDFQAIRNHQDLQCMAVPNKYKELRHFYRYYTEEKVAPLLTIVIGGNHEASNYMWELYHGGWLAPNIYFLGHAGCVQVNGIRIAGASGIFKSHDFRTGNHERIPYDSGAIRSIYHIREYCIRKLSLLSSPRIFLSHDWPQSIVHYGDVDGLLRRKRFFGPDISSGRLGSPPLMGLLKTLKPEWWFSAHLHTRFEATVIHDDPPSANQQNDPNEIIIEDESLDNDNNAEVKERVHLNPDEITLDDEEEDVAAPPQPPQPPSTTKFLALDKCLPNRQFLEVIDMNTPETPTLDEGGPENAPPVLNFDFEWLAITRAFHPWLSVTRAQRQFPDEMEARRMVATELEWVKANIGEKDSDTLPVLDWQTFIKTASGPGSEGDQKYQQPPWYTNPQTEAFCAMLQLQNKINPPPTMEKARPSAPPNMADSQNES